MKSNKYKIQYWYFSSGISIGIAIKKLDIAILIKPNDIIILNFIEKTFWSTLNNFLIEPNLLLMLKSNDKLSQKTASEILKFRLNKKLNKL